MSSQWNGLTPHKKEMLERASLNETSGAVLLQTYINRTVQQLTVRELGALAVMPRKQGMGDKEYINVRTALDESNGGAWVTDGESLTATVGSYAQKEFAYKTLATRGQVTRFLQARGRNYGDLLAESLRSKSEDFSNSLGYTLINGNSAGAAAQMNGLLTILNHYLGVNRFVTANAGAAPAAFSLSKLDETIDSVKGASSKASMVIICSKAGHRELNSALQQDQQFSDMVEIDAGFRVRSYDGIPIIQDTNVLDTYLMDSTGKVIENFSTGTSTLYIVLNLDYCYMAELTPTTVMPLAKASSQYDQYDIFWDGATVVSNVYGAAVLANCEAG